MRISTISELVLFLQRLEESSISFKLARYLEDSVSIRIVVPGERWEVDINQEGEVQVEIFRSSGDIFDCTKLDELFRNFSD